MEQLLRWIGRVAGAIGVLLCVVAFGARAAGEWRVAGTYIGTLLQGGVALAVIGCLAYCAALAERTRA